MCQPEGQYKGDYFCKEVADCDVTIVGGQGFVRLRLAWLALLEDRYRYALSKTHIWDTALSENTIDVRSKQGTEPHTVVITFIKVFWPCPTPVLTFEAIWAGCSASAKIRLEQRWWVGVVGFVRLPSMPLSLESVADRTRSIAATYRRESL
jgi:hypothetical protein